MSLVVVVRSLFLSLSLVYMEVLTIGPLTGSSRLLLSSRGMPCECKPLPAYLPKLLATLAPCVALFAPTVKAEA